MRMKQGTGARQVEEGKGVLSQEALLPASTSLTPPPHSFLIGEDGLVYEGRGWNTKGDHAGVTWNPISIGITFMGNYMERSPPPRAIRAAKSLLACGVARGALLSNYEVKGHRDVQQTLSPGDQLYEIIQKWPHYRE
ncbi:peptidoglycan recognition protein 1 [Saccopteryx leptura]|uniref:peptidoglycan recognition protein 1 n=1 Tax=Saccopteryx leptura TaxID=249018 RepID=UPI00339C6333